MTEIAAEFVFTEIYCGRRRRPEPFRVPAGIVIDTVTFWGLAFGVGIGAAVTCACGSAEPPPPPQADKSTHKKRLGVMRRII